MEQHATEIQDTSVEQEKIQHNADLEEAKELVEETREAPEEVVPAQVPTPPWCRDEARLSPEVTLNNSYVYVVRADTTATRKGTETGELCFVFDEEVALHVVESLAKEEVRVFSDGKYEVFMKLETKDPEPYLRKKIEVHVQKIGIFMNGPFEKIATFGYTRIPYATFKDGLTPVMVSEPVHEETSSQE